MVLSFSNSEEYVLQEILKIVRMQPDYQVRDMVLNDEIIDYGELKINPLQRKVEKNGKEIKLTTYEFETLYLLAKNPGMVFSKGQIYKQIRKEPYYLAEENVTHIISHLRRKIETDRKYPVYILTIRGVGYKFNSSYHNVS